MRKCYLCGGKVRREKDGSYICTHCGANLDGEDSDE